MHHFIYRTHNLINGKEYTGKHSTNDINDGYYGSGKELTLAIAKYGLENFAVEILSFHDSEEAALAEEARIVDEDYVEREDTYNIAIGGQGGNTGNYCYGFGKFKDKDGNIIHTSIDDPRVLSGELVGIRKNTTQVGPIGETVVKDKFGNTMRVSVNDPRYLSGELISQHKRLVNVIDKDGNYFKVPINDPRYLSGELKFHLTGKTWKNNMKLRICPHCGKEGKGGRMTVHHFNNCKYKF